MVMGGDLTWGVEHTVQYTYDAFQNCTTETYMILLTNHPNNFNKIEKMDR